LGCLDDQRQYRPYTAAADNFPHSICILDGRDDRDRSADEIDQMSPLLRNAAAAYLSTCDSDPRKLSALRNQSGRTDEQFGKR
jgi:hypothetical protein